MHIWKEREHHETLLSAILGRTGRTEADLLAPAAQDPAGIEGLPQAAALTRQCLEEGRPIVIVGDYDADGITATAILMRLLNRNGPRARAVIPKRFTDGYGISQAMVASLRDALLITVDNGIGAVEVIRAAKEAGNRVIVLDHHLPGDVLPPADVIVDPHIHPEENGFVPYCGAGLAYKLAEYLCREETSAQRADLFFDLLVLACLGTIADVMPLVGDNRHMVMAGLRLINHEKWYPRLSSGLRAILDLAPRPYSEETIKFQIAPILNATGRLYNAGGASVLKALLCQEEGQARAYAAKMLEINGRRKALVAQWMQTAQALADGCREDPALVLRCDGVPEGILGIVAGNLSKEHRRPVFVFSPVASAPGLLKGSGRAPEAHDLSLLLPELSPVTESAGGHAGAAGISVREAGFSEMKETILAVSAAAFPPIADDALYYDFALEEDALPEALATLRRYAPYGEGAQAPVLMLENLTIKGMRCMGQGQQHLKLQGARADAVGFDLAETYQTLGCPGSVDLLGTIEENTFRGKTTLQFQFFAIRPHGGG